jgi:Uma2 family endonuclease
MPLTIEEWEALPEDEPGELVDGELREEEVPGLLHELAVTWLVVLFRNWLGAGNGFVFASELKVVLSPKTGRKPDLTVVLPGRALSGPRRALRVPPDLMVEIVTPTPRDERRDRIEKMEDYARFGVPFYWLLDPALGSLEIFELRDGRYFRALAATEGTLTNVPGCEGLTLDIDALWAELARIESE